MPIAAQRLGAAPSNLEALLLSGYRQVHRGRRHIGQPVRIGTDRAVLRISSSARLVTPACSGHPSVAIARLHAEIAKAKGLVETLSRTARDLPPAAP